MTDHPSCVHRSAGYSDPPMATSKADATRAGTFSTASNSISFVPYSTPSYSMASRKFFQVITVVQVSAGGSGAHWSGKTGGRVGVHSRPKVGSRQDGSLMPSA